MVRLCFTMGRGARIQLEHRMGLINSNRSSIRLTIENTSAHPVDFLRLVFDDSTIAPAQQLLQEGNLSVFETYETEYGLINAPVFTWNSEEAKTIAPNQNLTLNIDCFGKVGWCVIFYHIDLFPILTPKK